MNNGLVFSPVLNFLQFNRDNGVNENEILKFGKEFFLDLPSVIEAKKNSSTMRLYLGLSFREDRGRRLWKAI